MGKKSALFFDIDGTLVDFLSSEVLESTVEALRAAKANGHELFVNTGRTICAVPNIIKSLPMSGFSCGCGTNIIYHGNNLVNAKVPKERCDRYIDALKECNVEALFESPEDLYFSKSQYRFAQLEAEREYAKTMGLGINTYIEDKQFEFCHFLVCTDEKSDKERFFEIISEDFVPVDRGNGAYECLMIGHTKATSIAYIQEMLEIEMDQIYVFGDSSNDLTMFEYADHTVAMGVHDPVLDPYTEYVTDTLQNDGIYKAMKHYGLI